MEMVKSKWDHFGSNFETLSIWILEKENELSSLEASASAADVQISQIKVTCTHVMLLSLPLRTSFLDLYHPKLSDPRTDLPFFCGSFKLNSCQA
jgi:hypothetical protein